MHIENAYYERLEEIAIKEKLYYDNELSKQVNLTYSVALIQVAEKAGFTEKQCWETSRKSFGKELDELDLDELGTLMARLLARLQKI